MLKGLSLGLGLAMVIVFLLLAGNFESFPLALSILFILPAVITGALTALVLTGTTLNIESFMGTIMAVGVAVANSILLVTFAERHRVETGDAVAGAIEGATSRLRPILMTSLAMLIGMIPMSLGLSEGGKQSAPLGRAVMGGLDRLDADDSSDSSSGFCDHSRKEVYALGVARSGRSERAAF